MQREGREPLPEKAGESTFLSRSGGEKGLRLSGAGTLGVPLEGTQRVGELLRSHQGVKYRFALKDRTWDFPGDAGNFAVPLE